MSSFEKDLLSEKVLNYAHSEFSLQKTVDMWHDTMLSTINNWKEKYQTWDIKEV
jgi:hypothetical protein